jgi:hypothetical protein
MDLKVVFTLLNLAESNVRRMAMKLLNDIIIFCLCGIVGQTETPAVLSGVAVTQVGAKLRCVGSGRVMLDVECMFSVGLHRGLERDMGLATDFLSLRPFRDPLSPSIDNWVMIICKINTFLKGVGLILYHRHDNGSESPLGIMRSIVEFWSLKSQISRMWLSLLGYV